MHMSKDAFRWAASISISLWVTGGAAAGADLDARLDFDSASALASADDPQRQDPFAPPPAQWSVTTGAAVLFGGDRSDVHGAGYVSFDVFLAEDFELALEVTGYYFDQAPDTAFGLALTPTARWHFLPAIEGERDYSIFTDFGIGVIGSTERISPDGTEFNFTPRAGFGMAVNLDGGARAIFGARWQHISNGRIGGGERNPSFDALMIYGGLSLPF